VHLGYDVIHILAKIVFQRTGDKAGSIVGQQSWAVLHFDLFETGSIYGYLQGFFDIIRPTGSPYQSNFFSTPFSSMPTQPPTA
jgi:hypothetical protein